MNQIRLIVFLFLLLPFYSFSQEADSFSVYFGLNDKKLNKQATHTLDSFISHNLISPSQKLVILGYADYLGNKGYNDTLSALRAQMVLDYLYRSGFRQSNVRSCTGLGKIDRENEKGKEGNASDRKVIIAVDKNPPPPATTTNYDISKTKANETIVLEKIFFVPGSHKIKEESQEELDKLYQTMVDHPKLKIRIEGHICCPSATPDGFDSDDNTNTLSLNRAKAVYDFLVSKGISETRMKFIGLGRSKPIIKNELSEEDRDINRRVEIRILEK